MIAVAIAMLIGTQAPQQDSGGQPKVSPSEVVSKMFARYAGAKSIVGTIKMTQAARGVSVHTDSELQLERPALIYLHQSRDGSFSRNWFLTSDGKEFSYDRPQEYLDNAGVQYGKSRFVEYVTQHGVSMGISEMLLASYKSLGDVNPMLETAVASKEWLSRLTQQWASLYYRGKQTVGGQSVDAITGDYRETKMVPISGTFEAYISDSGDFVRYVIHEKHSYPKLQSGVIEVTTTWDADLRLNAKTDPNLYKVLK